MNIAKMIDFIFKGIVLFFIYFILSCLKDLNIKINKIKEVENEC